MSLSDPYGMPWGDIIIYKYIFCLAVKKMESLFLCVAFATFYLVYTVIIIPNKIITVGNMYQIQFFLKGTLCKIFETGSVILII